MDSTLLRAGRTTHLKVLAVALAASIAIVVVGLNARSEYPRQFVRRLTTLLSKQPNLEFYAVQEALPFAEQYGSRPSSP